MRPVPRIIPSPAAEDHDPASRPGAPRSPSRGDARVGRWPFKRKQRPPSLDSPARAHGHSVDPAFTMRSSTPRYEGALRPSPSETHRGPGPLRQMASRRLYDPVPARHALRIIGAVGALTLLPTPAHAHLVTTGLGPLYDGISHLFLSFEDLIPVVALALLAGLNGPKAGRLALFVVPAAWLLGGLAGFAVGAPLVPGTVTAASFLVLGGLTAADRRLPPTAVTALAARARPAPRMAQRGRHRRVRARSAGPRRHRERGLRRGGPARRVRRLAPTRLDPDRRPRRRQLDRGDRSPASRLGPPRRVLRRPGDSSPAYLRMAQPDSPGLEHPFVVRPDVHDGQAPDPVRPLAFGRNLQRPLPDVADNPRRPCAVQMVPSG